MNDEKTAGRPKGSNADEWPPGPGWDIGLLHNSRDRTAGISLRKRFNRGSEAFMWMEPGDAKEIAAQLRRAASYLEEQIDD